MMKPKYYLICDDCHIKKQFVDHPAVFGIVYGAFQAEHTGHCVRAIAETAEHSLHPGTDGRHPRPTVGIDR